MYSVAYIHIKASANGHKQLRHFVMGMAATFLGGRHIINPIGPPDFKRDYAPLLDKCKIATRVMNLGQGYDLRMRIIHKRQMIDSESFTR